MGNDVPGLLERDDLNFLTVTGVAQLGELAESIAKLAVDHRIQMVSSGMTRARQTAMLVNPYLYLPEWKYPLLWVDERLNELPHNKTSEIVDRKRIEVKGAMYAWKQSFAPHVVICHGYVMELMFELCQTSFPGYQHAKLHQLDLEKLV
jgi:phosphohistidine phosphatase SixA